MTDRTPSMKAVQDSGNQLITGLDPAERKHIESELQQLNSRWEALTKRVVDRTAILEEVQGLAGEFQDVLDPLTTWLDAANKRFTALEPHSPDAEGIEHLIQELKVSFLMSSISVLCLRIDLLCVKTYNSF